MKRLIQTMLNQIGYSIVPYLPEQNREFPPDFSAVDIDIIRRVTPFTMTSPERILALITAVRYLVDNDIPGDIVECGVWKGGSMMAAALTLLEMNAGDRNLYLFDTYDGMTVPGERDISHEGLIAEELLAAAGKNEDSGIWAFSPLEKVRNNILSTGYDRSRVYFIAGRVEDTIPDMAPERISLLRLDTDWYESTYHELTFLYPRLCVGGILIVDDYGHWQGSRRATDQYLKENRLPIYLSRIDYTGRIAVKINGNCPFKTD